MAQTADWISKVGPPGTVLPVPVPAESGHVTQVVAQVAEPPESTVRPKAMNDARLRALIDSQYASVWRLVRRLGVDEAAVDDAVQEIFWVAARRLDEIQDGSEKSFLYGVALRVAATSRRRCQSRREVPYDDELRELVAPESPPDVMLDERRARAMLDEILDRMPEDLRTVLVLHELEGLQVKQIAELVAIPIGTAGSRLRRAREAFSAIVKVVRAKLQFAGETP